MISVFKKLILPDTKICKRIKKKKKTKTNPTTAISKKKKKKKVQPKLKQMSWIKGHTFLEHSPASKTVKSQNKFKKKNNNNKN